VALQSVNVRGDKHLGSGAAEAWAVALAWSNGPGGSGMASPLLKLSFDYCPAIDDLGVRTLCSGLLNNGAALLLVGLRLQPDVSDGCCWLSEN
jgi:hypothetical protein